MTGFTPVNFNCILGVEMIPFYLLDPRNNYIKALIRIYDEWMSNDGK